MSYSCRKIAQITSRSSTLKQIWGRIEEETNRLQLDPKVRPKENNMKGLICLVLGHNPDKDKTCYHSMTYLGYHPCQRCGAWLKLTDTDIPQEQLVCYQVGKHGLMLEGVNPVNQNTEQMCETCGTWFHATRSADGSLIP